MVKNSIKIEVALAFPTEQHLVALDVAAGTSVRDAIRQSDIFSLFDTEISEELRNLDYGIGVFGKEIKDFEIYDLQDGDRMEIYRPLLLDPKQARLKRAQKQKMSK